MKIFLDTANVEHIKEINSWGVLRGVTTNPSLVAREGRNFEEVVKEICNIVDGPVSAEAVSENAEGMMKEARHYAAWHENVIVKIPMTSEGLKAVTACKKEGIKTNVTLVFSAAQGLLAAMAGATYISPFVGRIDDISWDGMEIIHQLTTVLENYEYESQIIAASIRHPRHFTEAAFAGAHVATVPYEVVKKLVTHPLTDAGIDKFLKDWEKVPKK